MGGDALKRSSLTGIYLLLGLMNTIYRAAVVLTSTLGGCATSVSVSPTKSDIETARSDIGVSSTWLTEHRTEVENHIVSYIRAKYPTVPPDVRGFRIGRIRIKNEVIDTNKPSAARLEASLGQMFESVTSRFLGNRPASSTVIDIDVEFLTPQLSQGEEAAVVAAMVPLGAVCFSTIFMVCPFKMSNYVVLEATVKRNETTVVALKGVGGASRFVSTIVVDDSSDPKLTSTLEANSKAMAAAIADLGAKLVPYLRMP